VSQPNPEKKSARHRELPAGMADILPGAAERYLVLRRTLLDTMALWGYRPVVPALVEHAEVFAHALPGEEGEESFFRLVDRATGHVLSLRADFTPQVARIAATRFGDAALPLRFCYEGPVVRHVPAQRGRRREIHQTGAELLGVREPEADAECIALVIDCLTRAGIADFKVDVGQVEFFKGILTGSGLAPAQTEALTDAVARKDTSELDRLLASIPLPDAKKRLLAELPLLAGGVEILDRASRLVETDHSRDALENLKRVVEYVDAQGLVDRLTIDLGELRGVDYHTGIIFEAFVHHLGIPLCRGGRYDSLASAFGRPCPATGFSIDLLAVSEALALQHPDAGSAGSGILIVDSRADRIKTFALAKGLRTSGIRTCIELVRRTKEQSLAFAREQHFAWIAAVGGDNCPEGQALLINVATGAEHAVPLDAIDTALRDT
jgi:ATP phosphoribosyltransferase regulatory subunit